MTRREMGLRGAGESAAAAVAVVGARGWVQMLGAYCTAEPGLEAAAWAWRQRHYECA